MAADPTYNPEVSAFDKMEKKKKSTILQMGALFTSAKEACVVPRVCLFLGWFVSRITEKLQNVFPQNLKEVGSWPRIQKRRIQGFFFPDFNITRLAFLRHFH